MFHCTLFFLLAMGFLIFLPHLVSADTGGNFLSYNTTHNRFVTDGYGIELISPKGWIPSTIGLRDYTDLTAFYSPLENISDPFPTWFKIAAIRFNETVNQENFTKQMISGLNQINGTMTTNSENITIAGLPGYRVVTKADPYGNGLVFYTMSSWTAKEKVAYVFTYTGEQTKFNRYLPQVGEILASIKIPN